MSRGEQDVSEEHAGTQAIGCPVALCPICTVVTMTGEVRPDVVSHLLRAGEEIMLAVRAVVDARTGSPSRESNAGLERIEVE